MFSPHGAGLLATRPLSSLPAADPVQGFWEEWRRDVSGGRAAGDSVATTTATVEASVSGDGAAAEALRLVEDLVQKEKDLGDVAPKVAVEQVCETYAGMSVEARHGFLAAVARDFGSTPARGLRSGLWRRYLDAATDA